MLAFLWGMGCGVWGEIIYFGTNTLHINTPSVTLELLRYYTVFVIENDRQVYPSIYVSQ